MEFAKINTRISFGNIEFARISTRKMQSKHHSQKFVPIRYLCVEQRKYNLKNVCCGILVC